MSARVLRTCSVALAATGTLILSLALTPGQAEAATPPVGLGTATSYAVLAGSAITNTGASELHGDRGLSPLTAVSGFPPGQLFGASHTADAEALQAKVDLGIAYVDAAGRTPATSVATELGGITFLPGTYVGATLGITGTVTLDAGGNPDAVFLFKSAETLITAEDSAVVLIGSADPCNVYWQVSSSATLGTGTDFVGTVMAQESITATTGADVVGRLMARTGAVTLDTNVITTPMCDVLPPGSPTTTTIAPTTTTTAAPTTSTTAPGATTTTAPGATTTTLAPGTTTTTLAPGTTTTTLAPGTTTTTLVAPGSSTTTALPPIVEAPTTTLVVPSTSPDSPTPTTFPSPTWSTTTPGQTQTSVEREVGETTTTTMTSTTTSRTTTGLARTGMDVDVQLGLGLLALGGGFGILALRRRTVTS